MADLRTVCRFDTVDFAQLGKTTQFCDCTANDCAKRKKSRDSETITKQIESEPIGGIGGRVEPPNYDEKGNPKGDLFTE